MSSLVENGVFIINYAKKLFVFNIGNTSRRNMMFYSIPYLFKDFIWFYDLLRAAIFGADVYMFHIKYIDSN